MNKELFNKVNLAAIKQVYNNKGYTFFDGGAYDINLIGVRAETSESDKFDDLMVLTFKTEDGQTKFLRYPCTTDPGKHWLLNPMNVLGCLILVPGQHRRSHKLGLHRGYEALVQANALPVVRDNDKNNELNFDLYRKSEGQIFKGFYGCNIHRASKYSLVTSISKYSAGCQVVQEEEHLQQILWAVKKQYEMYKDKWSFPEYISYTLLEEQDFNTL